MRLHGEDFTVVGIARPGFDFPDAAQLWITLQRQMGPEHLAISAAKVVKVVGRVPRAVEPHDLEVELSLIAASVPNNAGWSAHVTPLRDTLTRDVRPALLILMGAVLLVMLIACANVGNPLLARGTARSRELAIRSALGASQRRLAGELLAESMLLATCGGMHGVMVASWCVDLLVALGPVALPGFAEVRIDARVLGFALVLALLTGAVAGAFPALRRGRTDLAQAVREGGGGHATPGAARGRVRAALVITEVAVSLILLIGAVLLIRTFQAMVSVDPGFRPERVIAFELSLPR